jgi:hypothetical protein
MVIRRTRWQTFRFEMAVLRRIAEALVRKELKYQMPDVGSPLAGDSQHS